MKNIPSDDRREWFHYWFDENYAVVYGHRDEREAAAFVSRWPIWGRGLAGRWCLDLGCGSGRFARAIGGRGMKVLGVDLSPIQLRAASTGCASSAGIHFAQGDIRALPTRGPIALAASLFTSFGYFERDEDHAGLLSAVAALLAADGVVVLDLPNRDAALAAASRSPVTRRSAAGVRIEERRTISDDGCRVAKEIAVTSDGDTRRYRESVRLFSANEVLHMTADAGLAPICGLWGDYEGGRLDSARPRMIFFGSKVG